jgi:hypothetical protein
MQIWRVKTSFWSTWKQENTTNKKIQELYINFNITFFYSKTFTEQAFLVF